MYLGNTEQVPTGKTSRWPSEDGESRTFPIQQIPAIQAVYYRKCYEVEYVVSEECRLLLFLLCSFSVIFPLASVSSLINRLLILQHTGIHECLRGWRRELRFQSCLPRAVMLNQLSLQIAVVCAETLVVSAAARAHTDK